MILCLILQVKTEKEHNLGKRRGNPYHNENRYIRTQLCKNIIHLSFHKYTAQNFSFTYRKHPSSVTLARRRNQVVSIETVQHNRKEFEFGPLVC